MPVSLFNRRTIGGRGAAIAIALMAAGCGPQYAENRPGTWRPTGANNYNLQAMIADQRDLTSGASSTTDRANGAVRAVNRLYLDRRRALLDVSLSKIAPSQSSDDSGGGGAGLGGAAPPAAGGGGGQ